MVRKDLAQLSREELIDMVLAQFEQVSKLQAEMDVLRLKLQKNQKPPSNSSNSSQPPSRDQKSNLPAKRRRQRPAPFQGRHGPPLGHEKHEREFVADPDHIVEVKPQVCEHCRTDLRQEVQELVDVNQI